MTGFPHMDQQQLEAVLGRAERPFDLYGLARELDRREPRILITGAAGSVGTALVEVLRTYEHQHMLFATDIDDVDVTDRAAVASFVAQNRPTLIIHLAGAKHAPAGELDPEETVRVNVDGTRNVLHAAAHVNARVITASTCKAADPETVYGATKLIAERMTLNERQQVMRFYNVVEASGNVFEIWAAAPADQPVDVALKCQRWFISMYEALGCLLELAVGGYAPGRYSPSFPCLRSMGDVARAVLPDWRIREIQPRRGDRISEPMRAYSETFANIFQTAGKIGPLNEITSPHDPLPVAA